MPGDDKNYKFDKNLHLKQALKHTPPPEPDVTQLSLPHDWQARLIALCEDNYHDDDKKTKLTGLKNKINSDSEYTLRDALNHALALIFYRLTGMLNKQLGALLAPEQQLIIDKLLEGTHLCMAGFHDRVEAIAQSIAQPQTLSHYLYRVRRSLILNVAAKLSGEVHANNHVTVIASLHGLGVKPLFKEDPYSGNLTDEAITQALQTTFQQDFVWFKLPSFLCDELRGVLMSMGYSSKDEIIKLTVYDKILTYLETLFDLQSSLSSVIYMSYVKNSLVFTDI